MTFGSEHIVFSDIYNLDNIVKHSAMMIGRNLLIDVLREQFRKDSEYRYVSDKFGFPKTPSQRGLDPDDGSYNDVTTRIFIGSTHREDMAFLPAITIRPTNLQYNPISFSRNRGVIEYGDVKTVDGYGNVTIARTPTHTTFAGAWDQTFEVKVSSRSLEDVTTIADIVLITLQDIYHQDLQRNGLFVKSVSSGGQTEENIGEADPIYHISISVSAYTEWARKIPIANLVDRIQMCFNFDMISTDIPATGLDLRFTIDT